MAGYFPNFGKVIQSAGDKTSPHASPPLSHLVDRDLAISNTLLLLLQAAVVAVAFQAVAEHAHARTIAWLAIEQPAAGHANLVSYPLVSETTCTHSSIQFKLN